MRLTLAHSLTYCLTSLQYHAWLPHIGMQKRMHHWSLLGAPTAACYHEFSTAMGTFSPAAASSPGDPSLSASAWPLGLSRPHGHLSWPLLWQYNHVSVRRHQAVHTSLTFPGLPGSNNS